MDDDDDFSWQIVGRALTMMIVTALFVFSTWAVLRLMIYDPAYNDGFEEGRRSLYRQCFERNACPSRTDMGVAR